eukprot:CAMPEP_0194403016 /NCGR_PEP_ID=MMETSP0176-20130528/1689_1 /TAXON_ID=216777 /ORGANISM="Proboscia alata, Strain PI-D3" /LENGTH=734 /DNA_ID=CAMNT_0039200657 /DNA_START=106 /DNA_END=2307 /DNA_ORIENTATION=-
MADIDNNQNLTPLEQLLGENLLKDSNTCEKVSTTSFLDKKKQKIFLYFSAHWCPPCRGFTPLLSAAYEGYKNKFGDDSETVILFVSRDNDEDAFTRYHKEMSFPAILFNSERSSKLMEKFEIRGIPSLVEIDSNGDAVERNPRVDFRSLIDAHGADAFPLTEERLVELKKEYEKLKLQKLRELYSGKIPFISASNGNEDIEDDIKVSLRELIDGNDSVGILLGDGDALDGSYSATKSIFDNLPSTTKVLSFPVVYLGWSLYDSNSDHSKVSNLFEYSLSDLSKEVRMAIEGIVGKSEACAPQLIILRKEKGLCNTDGTCEDGHSIVVVSADPNLRKVQAMGATSFPWDAAATKEFEDAKKAKTEKLKGEIKDLNFLIEPEASGAVLLPKDGRDVSTDDLFVGEEEGVVGLYFSAHWCPPCRMFTPKLAKCYEEVKTAGHKFSVVFVSSDSDRDAFEGYHKNMVTSAGDQFLAIDYKHRELKDNLSEIFETRGIPALILLKSDGTLITKEGAQRVGIGGAEAFPWDDATAERVKKEQRNAAIEKEKDEEKTQKDAGDVIVKRLVGSVSSIRHDISKNILTYESFSTAGTPHLYATSGVIYYELEVLENECGYPQLGFAHKDGIKLSNKYSGLGVGDNNTSWGVDGNRSIRWHDGELPWPCSWEVGNIIGLAANIDKGMIAVSKDGNWTKVGSGVVFEDDSIKEGVYPCFTGQSFKMRYCFKEDDLIYDRPEESIW